MGVRENLLEIKRRMDRASRNAPLPKRVTLVGITKGVAVAEVRKGIAAGLEEIGENRVQEAQEKVEAVGRAVRWHMVGHLQRNKVKDALRLFELIHSVDTLRLAQEIEKVASLLRKEVAVLLQVNVQGQLTQFGVAPETAPRLAREIAALSHVRLLGVMTIAPLSEEPEKSRPFFRRLRELKEHLEKEGDPRIAMRYLSMGMSQDFEVAIEEGSNMVRIGRAIFGPGS